MLLDVAMPTIKRDAWMRGHFEIITYININKH